MTPRKITKLTDEQWAELPTFRDEWLARGIATGPTGSTIAIPDHLEADAEVPVLSGLQLQGDLAIVPLAGKGIATANIAPVPPQGIEVVRGESGGHTHLLVGEGISWAPIEARGDSLDLGAVVVPDDAVAYLLHEEHGASGIAPGRYVIRRQREMAEQVRRVAD